MTFFGVYLGVLSFIHILIVRPLQAMLRMQAIMLRMFIRVFVGEAITSIMHVLREVFSTREVDIETMNTDLNGVFLRKQHWPSEVFRRGKVKSRCVGAYPHLHHLALPLTKPIRTGQRAKQAKTNMNISKITNTNTNTQKILIQSSKQANRPAFFNDAFRLAQQKVFYSPKVLPEIAIIKW